MEAETPPDLAARRRFRLYKSKHKLRRYTIMLIDYAYDNFWSASCLPSSSPPQS